MNIEILILKLFLSNSTLYFKYRKYLEKKYNNIYTKIFHSLSKLKEDGKENHSLEELVISVHTCYPALSAGDSNLVQDILSFIKETVVPEDKIEELLSKLKEKYLAERIAIQAVETVSGDLDYQLFLDSLREALDDSEDTTKTTEDIFVSEDIVQIKDSYLSNPPFKFRLKTLNQILGGLRRRTFGFLFARPEVGKTQLLASEATYLAKQVPNCLLWVNNEEDGAALVSRCYQSALLKDAYEILENAEASRTKYQKELNGKIKIFDRPEAKSKDIEEVIKQVKPDIVFIDQLDKVHGWDEERHDLTLKAKYQWARELAKKYNCAVLGVCQAGGEAEGKRYLGLNDVDSSKTAKQGEADFMFGLGSSDRNGEEDLRFISMCKNKLPIAPGMIASMRHAKIKIRSVPELQIYEDAMHIGDGE